MYEHVASQNPGYVDISHVSGSSILPDGMTPIVVQNYRYSDIQLLEEVYKKVPDIQQMSTTVVVSKDGEEVIEANGWGWTVVKRKDIVGCEDEAVIVLRGYVTPEVVSRARRLLVLVNTKLLNTDIPTEKARRIYL